MSTISPLKIAIKQIRGNSGIDVWAETLCRSINDQGHRCYLDLPPGYFQFMPGLLKLKGYPDDSDIVHGSAWNGSVFKTECPLVITEHLAVYDPAYNAYRTFPQKIYHRWIRHCEEKSLAVADAVVCVSEDTRKKLEAAFGYSDARVIHNGVDTTLFQPKEVTRKALNLPENKTLLLFAGNLSRRKGADLLPAIMNRLGEDYLILTTSGNRDKSQNNIPFSRDLGHLNLQQLIDAYNVCDIFLLPSRLEGLSLSTLEAMACGKPVVAFNCSSFPELIVDGRGGFLPEKDNVNELVERIRYLAGEPDLIRNMGVFNRERVLDRFTLEKMTREYIRVYQSLLK